MADPVNPIPRSSENIGKNPASWDISGSGDPGLMSIAAPSRLGVLMNQVVKGTLKYPVVICSRVWFVFLHTNPILEV